MKNARETKTHKDTEYYAGNLSERYTYMLMH